MQTYVNAMEPGWNLGNSLDAVGEDETAWGNPRITKELIQSIAAEGYNSIRIPVTWEAHIGDAPDYTIDSAYMNRVQEVVDWALDADLYVMINLHHDSWRWISYMEKDHDNVLARYTLGLRLRTNSKMHPINSCSKVLTNHVSPKAAQQMQRLDIACWTN